MRHGAARYRHYLDPCRCDVCRAEHTARIMRQRAARIARTRPADTPASSSSTS